MKRNRIGALAACLALACSLLTIPAAAKTEPGVYTAGMVTSYYNLDTGNVDDGGTANAALGEGMCRSATDKTALVEVDGDGNIWVTVRLLLQSNCSNVAFYTRSGYDSYSQVSYDIIAEDAANDSIDYRFPVTEAGQKLKCTMYVSPMGRDVLWYLYVDTSTLTSGSGDFVVSIDTSGLGETAPDPAGTETAAPADIPESVPAEEPQETDAGEETPEEAPEETPGDTETSEDGAEPDGEQEAEDTDPADAGETGAPDQTEAEETGSGEAAAPETSGGLSGGAIAGIAVVVALIAGAIVYIVKRKK